MFLFLISVLLNLGSCHESAPPQLPDEIVDTTSHDFVWERLMLGDGGSSILYDVAIISDTLAYAVGEVYLRDNFGDLDPDAFNLVRWDGITWTPMRIQFYSICGQPSRSSFPAAAVFAFGATDIWIAMNGDQIARWDGVRQTSTMCLPVSFSVARLWGESPTSVYAVGDAGNILHFDGSTWQELSSGSLLDFKDIYGARDARTGSTEILAVAGNPYVSLARTIVRINGTTVTAVSDSGIDNALKGVWFLPGDDYYVVGGGVYEKDSIEMVRWIQRYVSTKFTGCIRGAARNDVFIAGDFGEVLHYSGRTWKSYLPQTAISTGLYYSIAARGDMVIAVGVDGARGVILMGRRTQ